MNTGNWENVMKMSIFRFLMNGIYCNDEEVNFMLCKWGTFFHLRIFVKVLNLSALRSYWREISKGIN